MLIDGASATNFEQNSGIQNVPYTPSVDSVEEFKERQRGWFELKIAADLVAESDLKALLLELASHVPSD